VCCSVLQCVSVCCSVLQCVAVCCSVLQCVAVCCSVCAAVCCSMLQHFEVCCSVLQCRATGWRKPIGCLIIIGHFPQKSPIISSSYSKKDLQLRHEMSLCHPISQFVTRDLYVCVFGDERGICVPVVLSCMNTWLNSTKTWLTCVNLDLPAAAHTNTHTHIHTHTYAHTRTRGHAHARIHTHTHTCIFTRICD